MTDWIDQSVSDQQSELARGIAAARQSAPHGDQIKAGDAVLCLECLESIPLERLEAKPDATHCVSCLSELEG